MGLWGKLFGGSAAPQPAPGATPSPERPAPKSALFERHAERQWRPPRRRPQTDTYGDARFADERDDHAAMNEALGDDQGIWFGSISNIGDTDWVEGNDVSYTGDRHLLTVAPTRSGKGACAIIPNLLMQHKSSIVCIDPKGQNAAVTSKLRRAAGKVYCLNPFSLHREAPWHLRRNRFNPIAHLRIDSPNLVAEVAALAQALIVTESKTQPYFDNSARDLVEVLVLHAIATKGSAATLLDMRAWLSQPWTAPSDKPSLMRTVHEMSESPHPFIREAASRFLSNTDSVAEIVQSANNQTKFLSDPGIAHTLGGSDFKIIDFKKEVSTLYIILPDTFIDAYSRFLRLITVSALDGLRSKPGGVPTLVILDEFARLGHLTAVENAFALAAGYNVKVWPFVQDLTQLKQVYGERWESFIANSGIVQWFTPNDSFTAGYLSRRIGKTTIGVRTTNMSRGRNRGGSSGTGGVSSGPGSTNYGSNYSDSEQSSENSSEAAIDFMSAQDLYELPDYFQIVTLNGFKYPILTSRDRYFEWGEDMNNIRDSAQPDPYHLSILKKRERCVGVPRVQSRTAETYYETHIEVASAEGQFELQIDPPTPDSPCLSWWEPLRKKVEGNVRSASIFRGVYIKRLRRGEALVYEAVNEQEQLVTFSIYLHQLIGFDVEKLGSRVLPREYFVLTDQIVDPDDIIIWGYSDTEDWVFATAACSMEEAEQLRAELTRVFVDGEMPKKQKAPATESTRAEAANPSDVRPSASSGA
jgi:type IV secretion system protein VirD4